MKPLIQPHATERAHGPYQCQYNWYPHNETFSKEQMFPMQFGIHDFNKNEKDNFCFIEVFPVCPRTFIRGEGKTLGEAETNAWNKYQKVRNCENHNFEKRGYTNGAGFCKNCDLFMSNIFKPTNKSSSRDLKESQRLVNNYIQYSRDPKFKSAFNSSYYEKYLFNCHIAEDLKFYCDICGNEVTMNDKCHHIVCLDCNPDHFE